MYSLMVIIPRLIPRHLHNFYLNYCLLVFFTFFSSFSFAQTGKSTKAQYKIPDSIYLLLNEKSAIQGITRKNNIYTQTSLIRLLELNAELCSFYLDAEDEAQVNNLYNESYEILEYLRKFHKQSEFYPKGLVRFAYFLYKIEEYNEALLTLGQAKKSKFLTKDAYTFAVKVNAQVHYVLKNYQTVVDQFNLIKDKYYDQLDDDLLLVYAKALLKQGNFNQAYQSLNDFIKNSIKRKKRFSSQLLAEIHLFFVEGNKLSEGINFLKKYYPEGLYSMAIYMISRKKDPSYIGKSFHIYFKMEKKSNLKYERLNEFLETLRSAKLYRYMVPFFKLGRKSLDKKKRLPKYISRDYIDVNFKTLSEHIKYRIPPVFTAQVATLLRSSSSGFDAYLEYIVALNYLRFKNDKKSFYHFEQAFRLAAGENYTFTKSKLKHYPYFVYDRRKMVHETLDQIYLIFTQKDKNILKGDDLLDFYENYTSENPKGKYIHAVFSSLTSIYFEREDFDDTAFLILDYLDKFPDNVDNYRGPIQQLIKDIYALPDISKRDEFLDFIKSDTFLERIYENVSRSSSIAKAEFIFNLGLFSSSTKILNRIDEKKIQKLKEKNRYLILSARSNLKMKNFKRSAKLLASYIQSAESYEFDKYKDIILEAIQEYFSLQDLSTPYNLSRLAYLKAPSRRPSYSSYVSFYLYSLLMTGKQKELTIFINKEKKSLDQKTVNLSFIKIKELLLLPKNYKLFIHFLETFVDRLTLKFTSLEKINYIFHDLVIKNKLRTAKRFQKTMLKLLDRFNMEEKNKVKLYSYYRVRDLLYDSFKKPTIDYDFKIKNEKKFWKKNVLSILDFEQQVDEYRGNYAYTDLLISSYFVYQFSFLQRRYEKLFQKKFIPTKVTKLVDLENLKSYAPLEILYLKSQFHLNFVKAMQSKVGLYSSDYQLTLPHHLTRKYNHFYDYSPLPFVDKVDL